MLPVDASINMAAFADISGAWGQEGAAFTVIGNRQEITKNTPAVKALKYLIFFFKALFISYKTVQNHVFEFAYGYVTF